MEFNFFSGITIYEHQEVPVFTVPKNIPKKTNCVHFPKEESKLLVISDNIKVTRTEVLTNQNHFHFITTFKALSHSFMVLPKTSKNMFPVVYISNNKSQ